MRSFYNLLANSLVVNITNNFVWFALIYWLYLQTESVLATSLMTGIYLISATVSSFWFGSVVDHNKKKTAMQFSSLATLIFFGISLLVVVLSPESAFKSVANYQVWILICTVLFGVIAGNIRNIALPTIITFLVPEENRDKANGLSGTIMGASFAVASVASGLILGFTGMTWVLLLGVVLTALALGHLFLIAVPEKKIVNLHEAEEAKPKSIDVSGTIKVIKSIPGLFALIFFTTFNNFLGGVFMPLMDPYGLSLVSLQVWGVLWGFLSMGFIVGGLYIAKYGLGKNPLRRLFLINIILWIDCIFFTIQPSLPLLTVGMALWVTLVPFIEATEHTIIQKVVPPDRQGRVFGFAQSIETAASPITAFLIGPLAQFFFIPFMTTGHGVDLIGGWFGVGPGRGIALVFIMAGIIGLCVTLVAMRSNAYKQLSKLYQK